MVLYGRVSTADQTLEHQRTQAEAAGYRFDHVLADHAISGVSTKLSERPQGRRLFDLLISGDTLVVRWVDCLSRNYDDLSETIRLFFKRGVVIRTVINDVTFDGATTKPVQKAVRDALIAFMAATARAQADATKEAQRAGIEQAKAKGEGYRGRKSSYSREQLRTVQDTFGQDTNIIQIGKATSLIRQTIYRIKDDPSAADAVLAVWGAAA